MNKSKGKSKQGGSEKLLSSSTSTKTTTTTSPKKEMRQSMGIKDRGASKDLKKIDRSSVKIDKEDNLE